MAVVMGKKKAMMKKKMGKVMGEFKGGTLRSSSGQEVSSRKQAIAIGISEAQRAVKKSRK